MIDIHVVRHLLMRACWFILQIQICNEVEADDKVTSSESASGRLKHGLQKYAPVDEDANSSDNCNNAERTTEVNCVG